MTEIPEKITIGPIKLEEGKIHTYTAWGIAYKLTKYREERIAEVVFNSKAAAKEYIDIHFKLAAEARAIPVKRQVWMDEHGNVKSKMEPLG